MTIKPENRKAKIVCVDDDPIALKVYRNHIEGAGYEMETALTAAEAMAVISRFMPDLIFCDVNLPDMNGFELCRKVKDDPELATTIFILSSAMYTETQDAVRGLDIGADDYLQKPVNKDELLAKIKSFLRIKLLQDSLLQSNVKLQKAFQDLKEYKFALETKNKLLSKEKQMLENSLKQISLMVEERERTNLELERLNKVQEDNFTNLINLLSATIESKRQYHRGHAQKVAEIATYMAQRMELSEEDIRAIGIASRLHEIGKLSIPDSLAMKNPKEYTESEKNLLIQHPTKGAAILQDYIGFEKVSNIIKHFHENYDGSGVPSGLKGKNIPIGSRILAVANIFDNLVYRKKEGTAVTAFEAIEDDIGVRFDARVVNYLHKYVSDHPPSDEDKARELRLYELEPGMVLSAGIYTMSGALLLPIHTKLTQATLDQIANYNKMEPIEDAIFVKQ